MMRKKFHIKIIYLKLFGEVSSFDNPPFTLFQKCIRVKPPQTKPSLSVHCTQEIIPMSSPIIQETYESEIGASKAGWG